MEEALLEAEERIRVLEIRLDIAKRALRRIDQLSGYAAAVVARKALEEMYHDEP